MAVIHQTGDCWPTRRYHSTVLLHSSLSMEAFGNSSALYLDFTCSRTLAGPLPPVVDYVSGAHPLCLHLHRTSLIHLFFVTRTIGTDHGLMLGCMMPFSNMECISFCSISLLPRGSLLGGFLIGSAVPVLILCLMYGQDPKSFLSLANTWLYSINRLLSFSHSSSVS